MRLAEAHELAAATEQWQADFQVSRWVSAAGVILNIGLVLLATRLVYGDMRRRARQAINLRDQKQELEREVDERTRELTALSTHLQGCRNRRNPPFARIARRTRRPAGGGPDGFILASAAAAHQRSGQRSAVEQAHVVEQGGPELLDDAALKSTPELNDSWMLEALSMAGSLVGSRC